MHISKYLGYYNNAHASVSVSVTITPSGSPMPGEPYSLQCSATVSGTSDPPILSYQWLIGPLDNRTQLTNGSSITFNSNSVQFTTLRTSDGNMYTCQVTAAVVGLMAETTSTYAVELERKCIVLFLCNKVHHPILCTCSLIQSLHQQQ